MRMALCVAVTGAGACADQAANKTSNDLIVMAKTAFGDPPPISLCFDSTTIRASAVDGSGSSRSRTLDLALIRTPQAHWSRYRGDTVLASLVVAVAGIARYTGGGYPSYLAVPKARIDTVRLLVTPASPKGWRLICPESLPPYIDIHSLDDPGIYANPNVFREMLALADSTVRGRQR